MAGVSLIELMVVLAIAAMLLGIGTSSYKSITTSSRIAGEINGLLGDMQYARSEAIKQGQTVAVCVSTSGTDCTGGTRWDQGWIVVVSSASPPTTGGVATLVLRKQAAFKGGVNADTLTDGTTSFIAYDREGLALGLLSTMAGKGGAVIPLHDATSNATRTRCLQITNIGSVSVQQPSTLASCS